MSNEQKTQDQQHVVSVVQYSGKFTTDFVPRMPTAIPRNSASVPIVTAREGSPTTVTRTPLMAPQTMPSTSAASAASSTGQPASNKAPSVTLLSPTMLATERSISAEIRIRAIGKAMRRIGVTSSSKYPKVRGLENLRIDIDATTATMIKAMTTANSRVRKNRFHAGEL